MWHNARRYPSTRKTSTISGMNNIAELLRLINNLIRIGTIAKISYGDPAVNPPVPPLVRVQCGELLTGWIRWIESRAGTTRTWCPPTLGEQVVIIAPGGDLNTAFVLTGLFSERHRAPSDHGEHFHAVMPDGATVDYNHVEKHLTFNTPGDITITAKGDIRITAQGDLHLKGSKIFENA